MSKWIEEKGGGEIDQILEGHGTQFVVRFVSYAKPQYWWIMKSPFLPDVHKKFATLSEAKEYCEWRYQNLFGQREEITRLRADLAAVTAERDRLQIMHDEAYISGMKHGWNCCAAGEEERYKNSIENIREQIRRARAALEGVTEQAGVGNE